MFWKNERKFINSAEYETISKKIVELNERVEILSHKLSVLQTSMDNLRGNFNRKLKGLKKDEQEEEEEETKDINNPVILPYNGDIFKSNKGLR